MTLMRSYLPAIACLLLLAALAPGRGTAHGHDSDHAALSNGGSLTETIAIHSEHLNEERQIRVSLPNGYEDSDRAYPVLYVLDAEWIFDYAAGSVAFLSGELAGRMPETIVVGIPNTDRTRDLTVSFDTTAAYVRFMRFIESELIPGIDASYRTVPHRTIYGWSSGANISLWMLFTKPDLFRGYIASGTGISERASKFAANAFSTHSYRGRGLFACAEGNTPFRREALARFSMLLETSAPDGIRWQCEVMEDEDHTTVLPKGLFAGLTFLYRECLLPVEIAERGRDAVREYYRALSGTYGFEINISEGVAIDVASQLIHQDRFPEAVALLELALETNPESAALQSTLEETTGMIEGG